MKGAAKVAGKPIGGYSMRRVHAILYGYCDNVSRGPPVATIGWKDGRILFNYWKDPLKLCELKAKHGETCICEDGKLLRRGLRSEKTCRIAKVIERTSTHNIITST
jgi:hypothetical protein